MSIYCTIKFSLYLNETFLLLHYLNITETHSLLLILFVDNFQKPRHYNDKLDYHFSEVVWSYIISLSKIKIKYQTISYQKKFNLFINQFFLSTFVRTLSDCFMMIRNEIILMLQRYTFIIACWTILRNFFKAHVYKSVPVLYFSHRVQWKNYI